MPIKKKLTVSKVRKKAWEVFSLYIRQRDTNNIGTHCFTCGICKPIGNMQAGHFQPGRFPVYLFDERQVHAQCYRCNINLKGNWPRYYERMVKEYGKKEVEKMISERNNFKQFKVGELEDIYVKYKFLLRPS